MEASLSSTGDGLASKAETVGYSKDGLHLISWEDRCCDDCYLGPFEAVVSMPYNELAKFILLSMGLPENY